jgi:hypothetical protein
MIFQPLFVFASFLEEAELKPLEPKGKGPSNGQDTSFS